MELLIIFLLVLINGFFAMSEMALVSSRKYKIENAKKKGKSGAGTALELSENPTRFLSTVQIGITLIGVLLGVYGGESLSQGVQSFLSQFEIFTPYIKPISTGFIVVLITFISIVFGELFPKRLGMAFPESIAMFVSRPMKLISMVTAPFVWLLTLSNNILVKIFGIKTTSEKVSEEEIKSIIKESADGGEIQEIEQDIVERVFELGDRKVKSLFTHRSDMVYFLDTDTYDDIVEKINTEKHSAYPVSSSANLDDIVGIVLIKDLFVSSKEVFDIKNLVKKPIYINENTYAYQVLEIFKKEKMHYGMVVDEYGSIMGIVTMDDVVDALVGDVSEEIHDEYKIIQRAENSWLVDGQYPIIDFSKYFDISIEEFGEDKFTTVAGLIMFNMSTIPEVGDKFVFGPYELEVIDKDGQRIDKLLVNKVSL
jgi:putative hemolysin